MSLNFIVKEGPRKGDEFRLATGFNIGRNRANISLRDAKISSHHAKIMEDSSGRLILEDAGSANGIWVNEIKVQSVELKPGLVIRMGDTILEVRDDFDLGLSEADRDTWQGQLWTYLKGSVEQLAKEIASPGMLFEVPLILEFIRGPQFGLTWTLAYGPRKIGAGSSDLPIDDPNAPEVCFELVPEGKYTSFRTIHPQFVRLNERTVETERLQDGDIILFGDNEIRITIKPI